MAAVPKRYDIDEFEEQPSLLNGLPFKINDDEFYSATDKHERSVLRFELNCALQIFLELDRPVYLEGLGLFIPKTRERFVAYSSGRFIIARQELIRSVDFEKTDDISGFNLPNPARKIVELHELSSRIYAKLPLAMHLKWSAQGMRSLLRAYLYSIRDKVVKDGFTLHLSALGTLYALHNRHGETLKDWYAGSDMLLAPRRSQVLEVVESKLFDRPVFESALEPLRALYGRELEVFNIDFPQVLADLGVDSGETQSETDKLKVEVAVFLDRESVKPRLIYCTEGLRNLAYQTRESAVGCELVVQLPYDVDLTFNDKPSAKQNLGASRLLALGWALMLGTKGKSLRVGLGVDSETPLLKDNKTIISGVVTNHVYPLNGIHLCEQGEFAYANLVGISTEEAALISSGKRLHLLSVLDLRGLGQVTQFKRSCLMQHTWLE